MKILLVNQAFHPDRVATSRHLTDVAVYLSQEGHQVRVLSSQCDYSNPSVRYPAKENYRGVKIQRVWCAGLGKKNIAFRLIDAISFGVGVSRRLFFGPKPDIVMAMTTPPMLGVLTTLYSKLRGVRNVQYIMDLHPIISVELGYLKRHSLVTKFLFKLFEFTMRNSNQVVVLDRWMARTVEKHGAKKEAVSVVPLWPTVPPVKITKEATKNPFKEKYQLEEKFVVLYSGNHGLAHPMRTVLEAAKKLKNEKDIVFVFVGSGVRVEEIASFAQDNDLDNIVQLPFQPNKMLPHSLRAGDVHLVVMGNEFSGLVHPSKIYGVLAVGKPYIFVGPKESHICDILEECPSGYHFEHGEVEGLTKKLIELKETSTEAREAFGSANRTYVESHFRSPDIIKDFAKRLINS